MGPGESNMKDLCVDPFHTLHSLEYRKVTDIVLGFR